MGTCFGLALLWPRDGVSASSNPLMGAFDEAEAQDPTDVGSGEFGAGNETAVAM